MEFVPLQPGSLLAKRYKITRLLRQGGMGATYLGEDTATGRIVAIKQLVDLFQSHEERQAGIGNFLAELGVLKEIRHPQIPKIFDHFVDNRGFFFTMEFVSGRDFTVILDEGNRQGLSEPEVTEIGIHVCRVLSYLHSRKPRPIVHRDVKPSNIMRRDSDSRIILLDFGISRASKPKEGMMIGSIDYSPPEQHLNQTEPRSDIYSLGATLHELATGVRPQAENHFEFASPSELNRNLSSAFSEAILTALSFYPEERYQNAAAFEEALQLLLPDRVPLAQADPFEEALHRLAQEKILPALGAMKKQYASECQTHVLQDDLSYLTFTLGVQVPFELIVQAFPEKNALRFSLREGILSPSPLGEIDPTLSEAGERATAILNAFLARFESSRR